MGNVEWGIISGWAGKLRSAREFRYLQRFGFLWESGLEEVEVEFAGIGGMGFPSLPRVRCPLRDVRFAKRDAGLLGGIGWNGLTVGLCF